MILGNLDLNKIGTRLRKTDRFILDILSTRLSQGGLSDCVAENKKRNSPDGIYGKRRQEIEDIRIKLMQSWAKERGIDTNFAALLMYNIMSESCRVQDDLMVSDHQQQKKIINEGNPEEVYTLQRENLLELTNTIADDYDSNYGANLLGSRLYFSFERNILNEIISRGLPSNRLAIDIGCATGNMSFEVANQFERVIGYDISPEMIRVAKSKITPETSHVEFKVSDIENGIDLSENSNSLVIMNMGTAGDIKNINAVLKDIKKVLEPGGKFLLSFYNSESLFHKIGFIPWPAPLAAHIDADKNCLEVRHKGRTYFVYAKQHSVQEVCNLLSDLNIDRIATFPTIASVIPNIVTELEHTQLDPGRTPNKDVYDSINDIDTAIANSTLHCGTYIVVTGRKEC